MAVKLIIDSASDINEKEAQSLGIIMLPMVITFDNEDYYDGVNLLPNDFYEKLVNSKVMPKTSLINAFRFTEAFEEHTKNGDELVVITISSKLSGTYNAACQAAENFKGKVHVVDSLNACAGERILGLYALDLIKQGKSAKEIKNELEKAKTKVNVYAMIGTLEYLKKGGRISSTAAIVGTLLSIKPMISVTGGEVKVIGKVRGSKNAAEFLNKCIEAKGGIDKNMPYGLIYSGFDTISVEKYANDNKSVIGGDFSSIPAYNLGGTIGTHIGPGAVGIAFFEK